MTAMACLRIAIGEELRFADDETMAVVVARIADAHLESSWRWPRRFGMIAPYTFLLADPCALRLDPRELQELARSIQRTLFGQKGEGEVCLLMIEGDQSEVMRFAGAHLELLRALIDGVDDGEFKGRICRITPEGVESLTPPGGPIDGELLPPRARPPMPPQPSRTGWWGIYYLPKERFVGGSVLIRTGTEGERTRRSRELEDDLHCIGAARETLASDAKGFIFMPFDFTSIVQATARARLKDELEKLPGDQRARLAAIVLNVPREPSHTALAQMRTLLHPYVAMVDLHVSDPGFRVDLLPVGLATSVTLALDDVADRNRLAAIKSFLAVQNAYRAKRVWQGITDLATRAELDLCRLHNAPFLSGPRISGMLSGPIQDVHRGPEALPYREPDRGNGWTVQLAS